MIQKIMISTAFLVSTLGATMVVAQEGPGRPMGNPLESLDLTEAQMEACMPKPEQPAEKPAEGERPEPPQIDTAELASCLQSNGADVTEAQIQEALESHRAERPEPPQS